MLCGIGKFIFLIIATPLREKKLFFDFVVERTVSNISDNITTQKAKFKHGGKCGTGSSILRLVLRFLTSETLFELGACGCGLLVT